MYASTNLCYPCIVRKKQSDVRTFYIHIAFGVKLFSNGPSFLKGDFNVSSFLLSSNCKGKNVK